MSDYQEQAAFWRAAIELHEQSGQSIRGFCRAEGLKEHLFYRWRKQLGLSPASEGSRRAPTPEPSRSPGPLTATQLSGAIEPSAKRASASHRSFIPIKVQAPIPPPESPPESSPTPQRSSTHPIQIRLPNGIELTVCEIDLPTLLCDLLQAC